MTKILLEKIKVPPDRQRTEWDELDISVENLGEEIRQNGQLQNIGVDQDYVLLFGETRYKAISYLKKKYPSEHKWEFIEGQVFEVRDEFHRVAIELHENIKRNPLSPGDKKRAIARYHRVREAQEGKAVKKAGGGQSQAKTAKELGVAVGVINDALQVDRILAFSPDLSKEKTAAAIKAKWKKKIIDETIKEIARRKKKTTKGVQRNAFRHMDGITYLKRLNDETVDLLLTDVMYGVDKGGEEYEDTKEAADSFLQEFIEETGRVLKEGSHALIFCAWRQTVQIGRWAIDTPLNFEIPPYIWDKEYTNIAQASAAHSRADQGYEYIVHLWKGSPSYPERVGTNVLKFKKVANPAYPGQKPPLLAKYLIEKFSLPASFIVDPCMGSGTFVLEGLKVGRECVGCDINQKAVDLALSLLEEEE